MKRKLISMAVGAACAVTSVATMAMEGPKVYGRMDVAFENGEDSINIASYSSRLGFKGSSEINDTAKVIYQYEVKITPDSKDAVFDNRSQYVGISCSVAGTVIMGLYDTPLKQAQGKVDLFGDHAGDIKAILRGENKLPNVIEYISPKIMDNITLKIGLEQGEGVDVDGDAVADDGLGDTMSFSATYKADGMYGAFAYSAGSGGGEDLIRLVGGYKMDDMQFGIIFQTGDKNDVDHSGFVLSAAKTMGDNKFKAQFGIGDKTGADGTLIAIGVDHKLIKGTKAYAEFTSVSVDDGDDTTTIALGIQHKF